MAFPSAVSTAWISRLRVSRSSGPPRGESSDSSASPARRRSVKSTRAFQVSRVTEGWVSSAYEGGSGLDMRALLPRLRQNGPRPGPLGGRVHDARRAAHRLDARDQL